MTGMGFATTVGTTDTSYEERLDHESTFIWLVNHTSWPTNVAVQSTLKLQTRASQNTPGL